MITFAYGDAITNYVVRLVIFQWLDENTDVTYPGYGDVFVDAADSYPYLDFINPNTKQKIKLIKDYTFKICNGSDTGININKFTFIPPVRNIVFADNTQSGHNAVLQKGQIYYCLCSNASTTTYAPRVEFQTLLTYQDA